VGLRLDALADASSGLDRELLAEARTSIRLATERLRRLLFELRPPVLDEAGLAAALDSYLAGAAEQDGLTCRVTDRSRHEARPDTRAILYRIALEAPSNVRKHAGADRVEVEIRREQGGVLLRVDDDGAGFEPEGDREAPGHLGLVTMEERAHAAGGWWRLESSPGSGTRVECWLPDDDRRRPPD
jgi:signal transduction histidine kinase